jgi:hypothetical protein
VERWESASGSLDLDGTSNRSKDSSGSPAAHAAEAAADLAGGQQELFALDEEAFESPSDPSSGMSAEMRMASGQPGEASDGPGTEQNAGPHADEHVDKQGEAQQPRTHQFTLEIVRCRVLCPDWRDTSFAPGVPREGNDDLHGDALVLDVPRLLLQLPPEQPGRHPSSHPVEDIGISAEGLPEAATNPADAASQGHSPIMDSSSEAEQIVASASRLAFHVEVFDPGKWASTKRPFLLVPDVEAIVTGPPPSTDALGVQGLQTYSISFGSVLGTADARQLQVLIAALDWAGSELRSILGRSPIQPEGSQHHQRPADAATLTAGFPCKVQATIGRSVFRLRGASDANPVVQLDLESLSAEACRSVGRLQCDLRFNSLLVQLLLGTPGAAEVQGAHPDGTGSSMSPRSPSLPLGRSASAPQPYARRPFSGIPQVIFPCALA